MENITIDISFKIYFHLMSSFIFSGVPYVYSVTLLIKDMVVINTIKL